MMNFDLNWQWKHYLERGGLSEETMYPWQVLVTKRAFFAACGIMLMLLRDDISKLPEEEGITVMEGMIKQVRDFWNNETNDKN